MAILVMTQARADLPPTEQPAVSAHVVLENPYPPHQVTFARGVVGMPDLVYSVLPGFRPLRLDLYVPPAGSGQRPLVVYIHGGGWISGDTRHAGAFENWPGVLASLAAKGYVVASIEYRLSHEAPFPAAIQDVKTSIRWLRAHSTEYGIDKSRAVVWGGSAGGQLAALAAMSCGAKALEAPGNAPVQGDAESDCVQGVIAWYGVFDFATLAGQPYSAANSPVRQYLGCGPSGCSPAEMVAASPAHYVDHNSPPALLIHGSDDHTVPVQQSREFYALLKSKGVKVEWVEIPGVDHSFIGPTAAATKAASLQALHKSFEFIDHTVGNRSAAEGIPSGATRGGRSAAEGIPRSATGATPGGR